ncbi:protein kinase-like domain, Phloem protein 2-like protein [Artemisia annua]|uniref:Protein kinase-like domain, Phloem protein 2-like protein n=1 Tax=Artemisia annua TaxID=35608 RepID=A0A2U1ML88_ARTAN|nr:protein kinase-like domain, Phloem protein 2-like protein [Artemisia annua]
MASFVTEFKHLEIQLEDIISATNNFHESKVIGSGGFGKVYAGELSLSQSGEKSLVAIKRLDRRYGQGDPEFFKEIRMLSCYRHENLISLLGFCCQGDEMILIYEYASRGSLDRYLSSADLDWTQRLRICIDAAKGLSFLHDPNGTQQRVLHCDIKSANILLDKNMTAKVSDFGLSKMGPANQQYSLLITGALGTPGYCDPVFLETYSLTKESDVYSFGVVLLEILSGKLCVANIGCELKVYVPFWKKSYEENKLVEIIMQNLMQQMDPSSLKTFSDIAFECLRKAREERPSMSRVVEELEIALESQEFPDLRLEVLKKHEDILMAVDPLLIYKTGKQLKELLSKGLIIEGKTWLCLNEKGEHIERIYIQSCVDENLQHPSDDDIVNSRFPGGRCYKYKWEFKARVRGEYLTPHISYTINLVFRYIYEWDVNSHNRPLRYKIDGESKAFIIYPSTHMREDGWFIVPLYHFTTQHTTVDLQFEFEGHNTYLLVAGIEFQPSEEKVQLPVFEEYQHIVEAASQSLFYTSLDELKQILSKGVLLNGYKTWFSLNEKGQHSHMISMEDCLIPNEDSTPRYVSDSCSRFLVGFYQTNDKGFKTHVKTQLLSPNITYTVNLVYNSSTYGEQVYVDLKYRLRGETTTSVVYLANRRQYALLHMAELYQFTSDGSIVDLEIIFENSGTNIDGVEGIMFRPLKKVEDQLLEDDKVEDIETISDSDTYWEPKIPNDYEETLKLSKVSLEWKTKKELYSILCKGFLLDDGHQWFSIDKNGKKCQMLSARATVIDDNNSNWESSNESRFGEVLVITGGYKFQIGRRIEPQEVSPQTTYAAYLVFKLPQDQSTFEAPIKVYDANANFGGTIPFIYLVSPPHTPIIGPKLNENTYNPLNRYKGTTIPQQRTDGWMEVKVWQFKTKTTTESVPMDLKFEHHGKKDLKGLVVQGIELRPI